MMSDKIQTIIEEYKQLRASLSHAVVVPQSRLREVWDWGDRVVELLENNPPVMWWHLLNWDTMENTWRRMSEEERQKLRDDGIHPIYDSTPPTKEEDNDR